LAAGSSTDARKGARLFESLPDRRFSKYSPDQPRDKEGQWTDEGGSSARSGLATAGLLTAGGIGALGLRALDRRKLGPLLRRSNRNANRALAQREAASAAAERAKLTDRIKRWEAGQDTKSKVVAINPLTGRTFVIRGKDVNRGLNAAERASERTGRAIDRGVNAATKPLPPRVRERVRNELKQEGGHTMGDPAGKLLEFPGWLNPTHWF
jgi:hypothetical protein